MTWLLILHITGASGAAVSLPVGHMVNPDLCAIAGVGMTVVLDLRARGGGMSNGYGSYRTTREADMAAHDACPPPCCGTR